jgi:hypothetical protein
MGRLTVGRKSYSAGKPTPTGGLYNDANHRVITPNYLQTIGARLIAGRGIRESDRPDSPPVERALRCR